MGCRFNPFRFSNAAKKFGYCFTFATSTFCWISLLTYTINFANHDGNIAQMWLNKLAFSSPLDALFYQPMALIAVAYAIFSMFNCTLPVALTHAKAIRSRDDLADALVALYEFERTTQLNLDSSAQGDLGLEDALEMAENRPKLVRRGGNQLNEMMKHDLGLEDP